jgi:hypothetical protein
MNPRTAIACLIEFDEEPVAHFVQQVPEADHPPHLITRTAP